MMFTHIYGVPAAAVLALFASPAAIAQSSPWSVRVGPVAVRFDATSSVMAAGAPVPGAEVAVKDNTSLGLEIGYAITPDVVARVAVGVPPATTLSASGALSGWVPPLSGTLGKIKYGPAALTLTHAFGAPGGVRPYAGAGLNYTMMLASRDGDVAGLKVKNAWGTVLEAGLDVPLDGGWSAFVDLRKVFVKVKATGTLPALGGPQVTATVKLDPLLIHAGIGYRFLDSTGPI